MVAADRMKWGVLVSRIEVLLRTGPLTRLEICYATGVEGGSVSPVIMRMKRSGRLHVCKYVRGPVLGERSYIRAVYALGPGVDAKRPPALTKKQRRKSQTSCDPRKRVASVFDLGLTRDQRVQKMRTPKIIPRNPL